MVLLEKLWDDIVAGPHPERGLESLRKISPTPLIIKDVGEGSMTSSLPASPSTPGTPLSARKENVWRSVFHPGSNLATKTMGAQLFDKPQHSNSPSVYDWLYSGETKSTHRGGFIDLCKKSKWLNSPERKKVRAPIRRSKLEGE